MKKIIFGMLVLCLCLVGCNTEYQGEKSLVDVKYTSWDINEDDHNYIFFSYWIYNYGYEEAKELTIECELYDSDYNFLNSATEYLGNLASVSTIHGETFIDNPGIKIGDYAVGDCYIKECDGCVILMDRIKEGDRNDTTNKS